LDRPPPKGDLILACPVPFVELNEDKPSALGVGQGKGSPAVSVWMEDPFKGGVTKSEGDGDLSPRNQPTASGRGCWGGPRSRRGFRRLAGRASFGPFDQFGNDKRPALQLFASMGDPFGLSGFSSFPSGRSCRKNQRDPSPAVSGHSSGRVGRRTAGAPLAPGRIGPHLGPRFEGHGAWPLVREKPWRPAGSAV